LAERSGEECHSFEPPRLTTNIGRIEGRGRDLILTFDVRPLPDGDVRAVRAQLEGLTKEIEARYAGLRVRLETEWENAALAPGPPALVDTALKTMGAVGLPHEVASMAGCTEAGLYASAGIPAVVFGAGQAAGNAHAPNEWTSITQLRQAVEFYTAFIQAYCGGQ
jgi:acetylornithine deacetylase/succinyl-diaminopimelate desuccinylase-like protein